MPNDVNSSLRYFCHGSDEVVYSLRHLILLRYAKSQIGFGIIRSYAVLIEICQRHFLPLFAFSMWQNLTSVRQIRSQANKWSHSCGFFTARLGEREGDAAETKAPSDLRPPAGPFFRSQKNLLRGGL